MSKKVRLCMCGCGNDISHKRRNAKFYNDKHKAAYNRMKRRYKQMGELDKLKSGRILQGKTEITGSRKRQKGKNKGNKSMPNVEDYADLLHGGNTDNKSGNSKKYNELIHKYNKKPKRYVVRHLSAEAKSAQIKGEITKEEYRKIRSLVERRIEED